MYGATSSACNEALTNWLYLQNPHAPPALAQMLLYHHESALVGHQGFMPTRLKVGAEVIDAAWLMAVMVDAARRGQGLGTRMAHDARVASSVMLAIEVAPGQSRLLLRTGWRQVATLPLYLRPLMPARIAARHQRSMRNALLKPLCQAADRGLQWVDASTALLLRRLKVRLEPQAGFDARVDALWHKCARCYPVLTTRDKKTLEWRFQRFPVAGRYQTFYVTRKEELVGYFVLRRGEKWGVPALYVVDYLCTPRWMLGLFAAIIDEARRQGAAALGCYHLNAAGNRALRLLGFVRRDSSWPFMVNVERATPTQQALISEPEHWFLTAADSNLDRIREGTVFAAAPDEANAPLVPPGPDPSHLKRRRVQKADSKNLFDGAGGRPPWHSPCGKARLT